MSAKYVRIRFSRWIYLTIGSTCLVIFAFLLFLYSYVILEPKCYKSVAMEVIFPDSKPQLFLPKSDTWLLNWSCLDCRESEMANGQFSTLIFSEEPLSIVKPDPIDSFELNAIHPVLHLHRQNDKLYYYAYNWQGEYKYLSQLENRVQYVPYLPQVNLRPSDWHICPGNKLDKLLAGFSRYARPDSNYLVTFSFGKGSTYGDFVESMDWMNILKTKRHCPRELTEIEKSSLPIRGI